MFFCRSDAFLSLSSALNILKHEIPSPSNDQLKQPKSPQVIVSSLGLFITLPKDKYNMRTHFHNIQEGAGLPVNHQQSQGGTAANGTAKENATCNDHAPVLQKPKNQPDVLDSSSNSNLGMLLLCM